MPTPTSTVPKLLAGAVALLAVAVAAQAWYTAGMHKQLGQLHARADSPASRSPNDNSATQPKDDKAVPAPQDDDWFNRPFDPDTWDPRKEMQQMREHMDKVFGHSLGRFDRSSRFGDLFGSEIFNPSMDLQEEKDRFVVRVDLPGAKDNDVDVKLDGQQLTISGSLDEQNQDKDDQGHVLRRERLSGSFSRTMTLPAPVKSEEMTTKLENGVLEIAIPKA